MRVVVNVNVILDSHEREVVEEALRPYRVLTESSVSGKAGFHESNDYQLCLNRTSGAMRAEWLMDTHRKLLALRDALLHDSHRWAREADVAPEEGGKGSLIAKPKAVCTMLSETRQRQTQMCERALEIIGNALRAQKPVKEGAQALVIRAEKMMSDA